MGVRPMIAAGVVLAAGVVSVLWVRASETSGVDGGVTTRLLLDRITKLEARVAKLEQRGTVVALSRQAAGQPVPKSWKPFEFNGQRFYIVPLDSARPAPPPSGR